MLQNNFPLINKLFFFITIILVAACNFSVTSDKNPVFNKDVASIENELKAIVRCQDVNVAGKETKTGKKAISELEIRIINGLNIPTDNTGMRIMAKSIAAELKRSLKDTAEYNSYKVLFVLQTAEGNTTKSSYKGVVLNNGEF